MFENIVKTSDISVLRKIEAKLLSIKRELDYIVRINIRNIALKLAMLII